ncbi:MAG TPA: flagellar motor protein MotB, partial [Rhizomicrobium sp.]|nr:flagellar motor protein MotB [Rhizomicrobium sp.]
MAGDNPVIIKRIKKGGHGGHHGGAWKVAYADFVTAMMAFFLLMWLINTTTPEQKRGIADYFAAQSISQTVSGSGGILGGKVLGETSAKAGGAPSVMQKQGLPAPSATTESSDPSKKQGGSTDAQGDAPDSQRTSDDHMEQSIPSKERQDFASAAEAIRQAMQENPDIAQLSKQVMIDQTPEGLRIQLVDQDGRPMFEPGTAQPTAAARKVLQQVAKIVDRLPNRVSISGHTDSKAFTAADGSTNWELSASRANAARAILASAGLSSDRVYEVSGKAGSEP